eukprot:1951625-Rhodomonas_salina.4
MLPFCPRHASIFVGNAAIYAVGAAAYGGRCVCLWRTRASRASGSAELTSLLVHLPSFRNPHEYLP